MNLSDFPFANAAMAPQEISIDVLREKYCKGDEQSIDDVYRRGQEQRICISPVYRMDQMPQDAQFQARRFFREDPDGLAMPVAELAYALP